MKRTLVLLLILCLGVTLLSCDPPSYYYGEYGDLAAVARASIIGLKTWHLDMVLPLETDSEGRQMFLFYGTSGSSYRQYEDKNAPYIVAILIVQKVENDTLYFYGEQNYILRFVPFRTEYSPDLVNTFEKAEIDLLKERNAWDQPMAEDRSFDKAPNTLAAERIHSLTAESQEKIRDALVARGNTRRNILSTCLRGDSEGRYLYFVYHGKQGNPEPYIARYLVMVWEDGSLVDDTRAIRELDVTGDMAAQVADFCMDLGWTP